MLLAEPLKEAFGPWSNLYLLLLIFTVLIAGVLASLWTGAKIRPEKVLPEKTPLQDYGEDFGGA